VSVSFGGGAIRTSEFGEVHLRSCPRNQNPDSAAAQRRQNQGFGSSLSKVHDLSQVVFVGVLRIAN
jgi:hypothetical protein